MIMFAVTTLFTMIVFIVTAVTMPAIPAKYLLSISEAADHMGVHPETIRRYISRGDLTGYRLGPRLVRVDLAEVEAMLRPIPTVATARRLSR
jgi:excisionase family DNA binding protein